MRASLDVHAELLKLARVLCVAPEELAFLAEADPVELGELRAAVSRRLLARDRDRFERAVALGRRLPPAITANLVRHALGPQLAGHAAGLLDPDQVSEFASQLPAEFLADVAAVTDPGVIGPLVHGIDAAKIMAVTRALVEREEWVTMGAFVGQVGNDLLLETVGFFDAEALLRVGFVLEDRSRVKEIFRFLDDERLLDLLTAAQERDLLGETIHLVNALDDDGVARVGRMLGELSEERQDALARRLLTDADLRQAAQRLIDSSSSAVHQAIDRAKSQLA
jgi:hypothetical protein